MGAIIPLRIHELRLLGALEDGRVLPVEIPRLLFPYLTVVLPGVLGQALVEAGDFQQFEFALLRQAVPVEPLPLRERPGVQLTLAPTLGEGCRNALRDGRQDEG